MNATITSSTYNQIIPALASHFGTFYSEHCDEYFLHLPDTVGHGYIRGIDFERGLSLAEWNIELHSDGELIFETDETSPLEMYFCLEGELDYNIGDDQRCTVEALQGSLAAISGKQQRRLSWKAGKRIRFNTLAVSRSKLFEAVECYLHTAPRELADAFRDTAGESNLFYLNNYSIAIAECIHAMNRQGLIGISNTLYMKAKAWEILALMIRQYFDKDHPSFIKAHQSMRKSEVEALYRAQQLLVNDLKSPPTIAELAREVGLNKNKLQNGFKHVFGTTINQYLRDMRLKRAKMLLMESDKQIAEVADEVGYSNSSQFSKRFREKFGMLPSAYIRSLHDPAQC